MTSIIYNSFWDDLAKGSIDADTDTFKCMLVNATYDAIADETKKVFHLRVVDLVGRVARPMVVRVKTSEEEDGRDSCLKETPMIASLEKILLTRVITVAQGESHALIANLNPLL